MCHVHALHSTDFDVKAWQNSQHSPSDWVILEAEGILCPAPITLPLTDAQVLLDCALALAATTSSADTILSPMYKLHMLEMYQFR